MSKMHLAEAAVFRPRNKVGLAMASLAAVLSLSACAHNRGQQANTAVPNGQIGTSTLNVADAAIAGGNPNMALSVSQSVLANDPNNVDALVHEGDAYYALDRCPAAMASFQRALKRDAHASLAELGLGRCLLRTDPHAAEQAFMAAVQDDPGNANAYNDLGIARDLQGNFAGAVDPYQQALQNNPSLTAAEVNLGMSLALSGHGPEALQYLGPLATGQGATAKIREDYAAALVASGRDAEARQVLSVDLPPDQVNQAMEGFSSLISASIQNPPPPPPPAPTVSQVQTAPVAAAPITPAAPVSTAPTPLTPAASADPAPVATAAPVSTAPANANAAYVGPSPIPGAVSSSSGGAETAAAAPVATPAPAPVSVPATGGGNAAVQIASLNSQVAAQRQWNKISNAEPVLFNGKSPDISQAVVHGKTYYRLRVTGFDSKLAAAKFCAELSAAGSACTVANF
ncbi:SPOR domain-containing protein [Acidocella aromatica]|uniref:Flp pilus assembly protein TadD n=1 Tax=Acidocella aromatica TaxID=1303579 RepID=A0A840V9C5_9PROT|nr:SPOR domain-containing protein [Acidocella aromatica]MBB5372346.1 Flp pilus assembly protein TadD [Acidocella aromatica]